MPVTANNCFVSTVEIGYIEKAIEIYSRRDAENAKKDVYSNTFFVKNHMLPRRSLRLCEKTGC